MTLFQSLASFFAPAAGPSKLPTRPQFERGYRDTVSAAASHLCTVLHANSGPSSQAPLDSSRGIDVPSGSATNERLIRSSRRIALGVRLDPAGGGVHLIRLGIAGKHRHFGTIDTIVTFFLLHVLRHDGRSSAAQVPDPHYPFIHRCHTLSIAYGMPSSILSPS